MRDSIFGLEGLLEQETGLNSTDIMTDTAGVSDLVFGLFWLLGYQFSPRLADAGASVFWRMDSDVDYGVLNDIARGQSDPRKIVLQWDKMIRTAGSLQLGKVQASVLVRSLLKSERPSGLTQAIIEVGRINKTLYLLNYIDDEDYRRRILPQLTLKKSYLAKFDFFIKMPALEANRTIKNKPINPMMMLVALGLSIRM